MAPISTPFGATSTAAEVASGVELAGKRAIVTGGASGIGVETARAIAGTGAAVTLAVRDTAAGEEVARDIAATTGNDSVAVRALDLTDLGSIDRFVAEWDGPLDILVNNAGVMHSPETYTAYGWELQFATNHLGHFALTLGLEEALKDGGARVVSVSSSGHGSSDIDFDDLFFKKRPYDARVAYGQAKTANVLFAVELTKRWSGEGVFSNALMPGGIWTNLQRHWSPERLASMKESIDTVDEGGAMKTPEQGAATSVLLAVHPDIEGVGGRYFDDCQEAQQVDEIVDQLHGVRPYALDTDRAKRLWDVSLELLSSARG